MDSKLILAAARGTLDGTVRAGLAHSAGSLVESHQPSPAHQTEASGFLFRRKDLTRATDCFFRAAVRTSDMASLPPPTRGMNAAPLTAAAAYLASPNRVTSNMQPTPLFGVSGKVRRPPGFNASNQTAIGWGALALT